MHPKPIPRQISQFIAHENGFGCIQNQTYRKMQINLLILAPMKMVLDTSKTNRDDPHVLKNSRICKLSLQPQEASNANRIIN